MNRRQPAPGQDQAAIRRAREGRYAPLDVGRVAHVDRAHIDRERGRRSLDGTPLAHASGYGGIANNCCSRHAWRDLLEQFQPLASYTEFVRRESGDVAARPCEAIDKSGADGVWDVREYDR